MWHIVEPNIGIHNAKQCGKLWQKLPYLMRNHIHLNIYHLPFLTVWGHSLLPSFYATHMSISICGTNNTHTQQDKPLFCVIVYSRKGILFIYRLWVPRRWLNQYYNNSDQIYIYSNPLMGSSSLWVFPPESLVCFLYGKGKGHDMG